MDRAGFSSLDIPGSLSRIGDKGDGATGGSDICIGIRKGDGERSELPPKLVFPDMGDYLFLGGLTYQG